MTAAEIAAAMKNNINIFSDTSKVPWFNSPFTGEDGGVPQAKVGAVWNIDGPLLFNPSVKVTGVGDLSVALSAMKGHPEAGFITFSVSQAGYVRVVFTIDSTFQAASGLDRAAYVFPGSQIQTRIWMNFLDAVIRHSGGTGKTSNTTTVVEPKP